MLKQDYILHVQPDTNSLNRTAADYWLAQAIHSIECYGSFHVALTGGSSPIELYHLLTTTEYAEKLNWQYIHIYLGDERYVPHNHADSNFGMARKNLLDHIPVPVENLHPIPTSYEQAFEAAVKYEQTLQQYLPKDPNGFPQFDLIMLGMGDDGHTASLFPETEILQQFDKQVDAVYVQKLASWRISLTYPCLNHARQIMFMVKGENKSEILKQVLTENSPMQYPVQAVLASEQTHWFIDQAAASQLDSSSD
ncbi:MAG: 6-phosphogluconolactonase [Gammaproteobacteria bacterium]|nr:6-phosphogluconolactonase [Gammaproteobacteria bacterium]